MYLCNYLVYLGNNKKCKQYFLLLNHTNICTHLYFYKKKGWKNRKYWLIMQITKYIILLKLNTFGRTLTRILSP